MAVGVRVLGWGVAGLALLLAVAWAVLALHFDGPRPAVWPGFADALAAALVVAVPAILIRVRPLAVAVTAAGALLGGVVLWWLSLVPSNTRAWQPDVARIPTGELHGDRLTLHNVRNFDYRSETDFTERWETRTYDLATLRGLDLFLSYWGSPAIAHTILSWEFADGEQLAVSIETRKEIGEQYSAIGGFFRQYELCYVAADERDVVRLRTNYRGETVQLYRLTTPPAQARAVLLDYVAAMNALATTPRWYNAATQNCTTTIRTHTRHVGAARPWDWRILLNGYADELLYEQGIVDTSLPFAELRARARIDERARAADDDAAFSRRIRDGLPRP